jgi:hypothetical protein
MSSDFIWQTKQAIDIVTFKIEYCDNSKSKNLEEVFKWVIYNIILILHRSGRTLRCMYLYNYVIGE